MRVTSLPHHTLEGHHDQGEEEDMDQEGDLSHEDDVNEMQESAGERKSFPRDQPNS